MWASNCVATDKAASSSCFLVLLQKGSWLVVEFIEIQIEKTVEVGMMYERDFRVLVFQLPCKVTLDWWRADKVTHSPSPCAACVRTPQSLFIGNKKFYFPPAIKFYFHWQKNPQQNAAVNLSYSVSDRLAACAKWRENITRLTLTTVALLCLTVTPILNGRNVLLRAD